MADKDFSMFELSSGLPLDGARAHSVSAEFTYNQEYADNAVVLDIGWQVWDGVEDDDNQDVKHQLYSVGKKWEPVDEGARVQNVSGKRQMFNNQTNIGRLVTSLLTSRGDGDPAAGLEVLVAEIPTYGEPDSADFWLNMDVTLGTTSYPLQTKDSEGNAKIGNTQTIAEFHGRVGDEAPEAPKAPAKAAAKGGIAPKGGAKVPAKAAPAAEAAGGEDAWKEHLGRPLYAKLVKLAKTSDSHDAFMDAAFADDDVTTDDKAWNKVTERLIMAFEDDGFYAVAKNDA